MMKKFESRLRYCGAFALISVSAGYALTNGPSMPEYTQFEQVEMTDIVNLSSGSFTWSVPVMTVPGPALGFPLVLSYHSNPGQKAEASWVGLGWNLQAGAITRQVNKIPDDFKDVAIYESIKSSSIHGWSASISYNGVTVGYSYHSLKGSGGTIGYNLLGQVPSMVSLNATYGWGSAQGASGVSMGVSYGLGPVGLGNNYGVGLGAGLSIGITADGGMSGGISGGLSLGHRMADQNSNQGGRSTSASLASVGVSLSHSSGLGAGISALGLGSSPSAAGSWKTSQGGIVIPIPINGLWTVGFSRWRAWIEGYEKDHYFGFLHGDAPGMGCEDDPANEVDCMHATSSSHKQRHEYLVADRELENGTLTKLMRTGEDSYVVTAQGISGSFAPHRKEDGDYSNSLQSTSKLICDWVIICDRDEKNRTQELDLRRNRLNARDDAYDIYWRYADDMAGAEFTSPSTTSRDVPATVSIQSKKIQAKYSEVGKLVGFDVINTSGARYSFDFPLLNVWEGKYGYQNGDISKYTSQEFGSGYAYAWLLTSIKSLDYVDNDDNGVSESDFGGWVKFTYGDGNQTTNWKPVQYWATPYHDPTHASYSNAILNPDPKLAYSGPNPQTNITTHYDDNVRISNSRSRAHGLKEIAYIQKIETPTHEAIFTTVPRLDSRPFKVAHAFELVNQPNNWDGGIAHNENGFTATVNVHAGSVLSEGVNDLNLQSGQVVDIILFYNHTHGGWYTRGNPPSCIQGVERMDSVVFSQVTVGATHTATHVPDLPTGGDCYIASSVAKVKVRSSVGTRNSSRRLESIALYEKAALRAAGNNASEVKPISKVQFKQDYSLSRNTPNSYGVTENEIAENPINGKLTLKELVISGDGTFETQLPPYRFHYGYNPPFQIHPLENWVPWELGQWDRWGNQCRYCNDGFHEPDSPDRLPSSAAWNLDRIATPSGAELSVTYGRKEYSYIGSEPIAGELGEGTVKMLIASGGPEMFSEHHTVREEFLGSDEKEFWWHFRIPLANIREKVEARGWNIQGYHFEMVSDEKWDHISFASTPGRCAPEYDNSEAYPNAWIHISGAACGTDNRLSSCSPGFTEGGHYTPPSFRAASVYLEDGVVGNAEAIAVGFRPRWTFLNGQIPVQYKVSPEWASADFKLYALLGTNQGANPNVEGADGAVVKEIKMREPFSNTIQTTHYLYENGVTPTLPATYSDYGDDRDRSGRGLEYFRGSPGVTYSKVTATINQKHKTEYYFLTAKDLPTQFGTVPNANGQSTVSTTIMDMSALWGALWKKVDLDESGAPVRTTTNSWGANIDQMLPGTNWDTQLPTPGILQSYPKAGGQNYVRTLAPEEDFKSYFGIHQTISGHRYFNKNGCYVGDDCQANIIASQVVLKRVLPAAIKTETEQQGLRTVAHSYYHDFRSGEPLKSRLENSDGSVNVTEKHPAYDRYMFMQDQNALTQEYAKASYHYPAGSRTNFLQEEESGRATATKLTIWRPYSRETTGYFDIPMENFLTYRQFQTLAWRENPGTASVQHWIPDDRCYPSTNNAGWIACSDPMSNADPRWQLVEQVHRYDFMGHATEVMDARGINHTTLYGHHWSHPVAFLENTPPPPPGSSDTWEAMQAFYESFEGNGEFKDKLTGTPSDRYAVTTRLAKSGSTALEVKNIPGTSSGVCLNLGRLETNREYQASAWYYDASDGALGSGTNATRPGIFIGKLGGCSSEYHPNGIDGPGPFSAGGGGGGEAATGSRTWKRIYATVHANQCPDFYQLSPTILCVHATKGASGKNVLYDEIRVKPGGARMSTFTYDKGRMTSSVDIREVTTFYDYDGLGNLSRIRNDDGVIVSEQAKRIGRR